MKLPLPRSAAALLLGLAPLAVAAGGSDELWEISSRVEDRLSRFASTPAISRQCLRPAAAAAELVPMDPGCHLTDQQVDGTRVSFRFECLGRHRMIGSGEFDRPDSASYDGTLQMRGTADGQPIDLAMSYRGRRIGNCAVGDSTAPARR